MLISFAGESRFTPLAPSALPSHLPVRFAPGTDTPSIFFAPSFAVARNIVVLPKSVTPSRIIANLALVKLDEEDMKTLLGLSEVKGVKRYTKGAWGVNFGFEDGF